MKTRWTIDWIGRFCIAVLLLNVASCGDTFTGNPEKTKDFSQARNEGEGLERLFDLGGHPQIDLSLCADNLYGDPQGRFQFNYADPERGPDRIDNILTLLYDDLSAIWTINEAVDLTNGLLVYLNETRSDQLWSQITHASGRISFQATYETSSGLVNELYTASDDLLLHLIILGPNPRQLSCMVETLKFLED